MDVAQAKRVAAPGWLNLRTVLGLLLFVVAFAGGQRVLNQASQTVPVLAATRDIPQDARLSAGDVRLVDVKLPSDLLGRYATSVEDVEGAVATRPVQAGELLAAGWLSTSPSKPLRRAITLPVPPEHAVGGALTPGDRVDVFATFDSGDVRARTVPLARGVEVLGVVTAGGLVDEESAVGVTVSVDPRLATNFAFAIRAGEIDVARVDGATGETAGPTVRSEDFR